MESALGVPCAPEDGVQRCDGDVESRVASWDGVPLDVEVTLPPPEVDAPYPLVVFLHGWAGDKGGEGDPLAYARAGFAVLRYSARGFGESCGSPSSRSADPAGCERGWLHAADVRYEARDTQQLAGLLADEGLARPRRIGVTGTSYGGVQTFILASLRDRVMLADGRIRRWRSPRRGLRMRIAAAAPRWGWSLFPEALVPAGNALDYLARNPYGPRIGVPKLSYFGFLYPLGLASGYYAPPGADPSADITNWFTRATVSGEPYDSDPQMRAIIREARTFHSAYAVERRVRARRRGPPAPVFAYNAWTDDLNSPTEAIRYFNLVARRHPRAELSALFAAGQGHPRASLTAATPDWDEFLMRFFRRHLQRGRRAAFGIRTYTQACGGDEVRGPFVTRTWSRQSRGEVRVADPEPRTVDGRAAALTSPLVDPFASTAEGGCVSAPAAAEPGVAAYRVPPAAEPGYTLVGMPTVIARIETGDEVAQVQARLWDVGPDGSRRLVTRGTYRPRLDRSRRQVFQLQPNGWWFAPGHEATLELLGSDPPYARPSVGAFGVRVSDLELRLPVRERGGASPDVLRPLPPVGRDGRQLRR